MTKQELQNYYWLKRNIQKLEHRIIELDTLAAKQTTRLKNDADSRVSHAEHDRLGAVVAEMVDIKRELGEQLREAYEAEERIQNALRNLPEREKYLIRARYVESKKWEQICLDMNLEWAQVHRVHARALKQLA
ncbi:hypothetical protein [Desulfitobacterium hafniense]|nr:hypothetical protein [Desulfitobacterium hafniense]